MRLRATHTMTVESWLPPALEPLRALSQNLYWTWCPGAAAVFSRLSPHLWEETGHNPVLLLQRVERPELEERAADPAFVERLTGAADALRHYLTERPAAPALGGSAAEVAAYFSFEFALTESLPTYSGGLGVLAGDHVKSASDLGLPLVAMGLLYRQGYFQQSLAADGWQIEEYRDLDPMIHAMRPVLDDAGQELRVAVPFPGRDVVAGVWRLEVGRVPLFLLDTAVAENSVADRAIASRLYGGDMETRIQQEMLLGIGGVRALRAMGLRPGVCHMNEGHSSLLAVERIRLLMEEERCSFDEARVPVSAATAFTTHTAVAAGIDLFAQDLVLRYLGAYYQGMGLDDHTFLGLGRMDPGNDLEPFSMAMLGLRLSGFRNGVSELHREVSQQLWEGAWPGLPHQQAPIRAITNGVHLPTWVGTEVAELLDHYVGERWREDPAHVDWRNVEQIPDGDLWSAHERQRQQLIERARRQHRERGARMGPGDVAGREANLNPDVLTIGFARRFASYKRATLLFRDPVRLARILNSAERPVQILFAGKAHPRDEAGKELIREVVRASREPGIGGRVGVLEHYDVDLARSLVQGCDAWLNTPLRPLEASGTSGMKAVANGAIHLSVLDGWWAEAYEPDLGWAIGGSRLFESSEAQDAADAESLYVLLEESVVPAFYEREEDGIPGQWIAMMKRSLATFAPRFSTHRMVGQYAAEAYAPAAERWASLRSDGMRRARELAAWLRQVKGAWPEVKVLSVGDDAAASVSPDSTITVSVQVHPGSLAAASLLVSLVFGPAGPDGILAATGSAPLTLDNVSEEGVCDFSGTFAPTGGGRVGYAVRLVPYHPDLVDPADTGLALWV